MTPESAAPNWDAVDEDVRCPLCDYQLRGLIEPRCPECGYPFVWRDLIDPSRRLHPFLFEHHPERNAWSFWKTLTATWRPRRFWKSLHPAQPSRMRRLILYWFLSTLPMLLTAAANPVGLAIAVRRENQTARAFEKNYLSTPALAETIKPLLRQYGSLDAYLDTIYPVEWAAVFKSLRTGFGLTGALYLPAIAVLAWSWLTYAALSIFRISMTRAKVKKTHVVRCICYSADVGFWLGLAIVPAVLVFAFRQPVRMPWNYLNVIWWELRACGVAMIVFGYRLMVAYRSYLRFQRSFWVILSSQIIAFLLLSIMMIVLSIITR